MASHIKAVKKATMTHECALHCASTKNKIQLALINNCDNGFHKRLTCKWVKGQYQIWSSGLWNISQLILKIILIDTKTQNSPT